MSHLQLALRLKPEFPERQKTSLGHPELVCRVLIEPEVAGYFVEGIEVDHSLHNFGSYQELLINIVLRSSPWRLVSIFIKLILLFFVSLFLSLTEVIIDNGRADGVTVDGTRIVKINQLASDTHHDSYIGGGSV